MSPFDRGFYSSAPVCIMSPQPVHQYHDQIANPAFPFASDFKSTSSAILSTDFRASRSRSQTPQPQPPVQAPPQRPLNAGRKRSRDDADLNEEIIDAPPSQPTVDPIKESEDEWVYGPGMTPIKANQGYVADAGSQSGTWVEERAAAAAAAAAASQSQQYRPSLRSTKSLRLNGVDTSGFGLTAPARSSSPGKQQSHHSQQSQYGISPTSSSASLMASASDLGNGGPVVDNFTMHLGIGWSAIAEGPKQAAARGWARYIENHYPLTGVTLRLESRGLESYLVEADQGFFLFAEDLRQARLVSREANRALENLQRSPPVFDEEGTLCAGESPSHAVGAGTPASEMMVDMEMS